MDRRQMVVQRVREFFGERVDDVLHMVRQDRQELRGWEEPAHLRAALRRSIRAEGSQAQQETDTARTLVFVSEFGRAAGEPDRGQQREAMVAAGLAQPLQQIGRHGADEEGAARAPVGAQRRVGVAGS